MKATLSDIAKKTGLSVASVSRALHRADSPNVSHSTRERVLSVAREIGYQPNLLSRSLVTGRTHTISYWTYNVFAPYYSAVARAVWKRAAQRGYFVHMHNTLDWAHQAGDDRTGAAMAMSFDGMITCDVSSHGGGRKFPAVPLVSIGIGHDTDCDFVGIDLEYGAYLVMEHLFGVGARRIAYFGKHDALRQRDPRAVCYDRLMREAGAVPEWIETADDTRGDARRSVRDYVREKGGTPEAIFCMNDEVAVGCYRGLADLGIEVPRDVLLVGCDGLPEAEFQRCPITTIATPIEQMCELAWDFLEARMRNPREREFRQITLKPDLIVRESTSGVKETFSPAV